jgi:hypothetical protein
MRTSVNLSIIILALAAWAVAGTGELESTWISSGTWKARVKK